MDDDWRVVFESRHLAPCKDRALVLAAVNIPHQVVRDEGGCVLIVPASWSSEAVEELNLYEDENPPVAIAPPPRIVYQDAMPGIFAFTVIIALVAWADAVSFFGMDWRSAGRVDGELIRGGEVWRLATALTLHSGAPHLAGNLVFGCFFGFFAGRLLGSGVAWGAIVLSAMLGNFVNIMLLDSNFKSIGASTAVFAALGMLAGYVWRARLMSQERWPYRWGPVVGGLALLMFTGTGDENTDVGAHLMGFLAGFGSGVVLTRWRERLPSPRLQLAGGAVGVGLILLAWSLAIGSL